MIQNKKPPPSPQEPLNELPPVFPNENLSSVMQKESIDLLELGRILLKYKWIILGICWVLLILAIVVVSNRQVASPEYAAEVTFLNISSGEQVGRNTPNLDSLGQFASLAGVSLPQEDKSTVNSLEVIIKSRNFTVGLIDDLDLLPLFYKNHYDPRTNSYNLDQPPNAINVTNGMLGAMNLSAGNGLSKLTVTWNQPEMAAKLANYYLESFETYQAKTALTANQKALQYIQEQLKRIEADMWEAERRLREFSRKYKIIKVGEQFKIALGAIGKLQQDKFRTEMEKEILVQTKGEQSLDMRKLEFKIDILRKQQKRLIGEVLEEKNLVAESSLGLDLPLSELRILAYEEAALERDFESKRKLVEMLRIQLETTKIQVEKESNTIKVIDSAIPPIDPIGISENKRLIIALAGVLALVFAIFMVFVIDFIRKQGFFKK